MIPRPAVLFTIWLALASCSGEPADVSLPADPDPDPDPSDPGTIQIDPSTTFQTIRGWETTTYAAEESWPRPAYDLYIEPLLERAVDEVGINRLRLSLASGAEHDQDNWSRWQAGEISHEEWRGLRNATVNDNEDAHSIDWTGFHFSWLADRMANVVLPMQAMLEARGEQLYVGLHYVAGTKSIPAGTHDHFDPEEYAEFIQAAFRYLDGTFGWVPDGLEILNEPDNQRQFWDEDLMAEAIVKVTERLAAEGYVPDIIAPATTQVARATDYVRRWVEAGGIIDRVHTLSYHRYGRFSDSDLEDLAGVAMANGLEAAMLEWWSANNSYLMLHKDLKVGMNSSWQYGSLAGLGPMDLYRVDASDPSQPLITLAEPGRYIRQYFKYIRSGAVRIGAASINPALDPLAFVNADGGYAMVVAADGAEEFTVSGLPPGDYGVTYATEGEWNVALPDQTIGQGGRLSVAMPARGVLTVFAK